MITQDIKLNINKIDFDLKNLFENVYIKEKTLGNQFYFEVRANSTFFNINESADWKRAESIVKIIKSDVASDMVKWSYSINPLNESADWIERVSNINVIAKDIFETITKSRMDKSYFESLESIVESINENATEITKEITKDDLIDKLKEIAARFEVEVKKVEKSTTPILEGNQFMTKGGDVTVKLFHNSDIKVSDKFKIESEINSNTGVKWTLFKEGFIEVSFSEKESISELFGFSKKERDMKKLKIDIENAKKEIDQADFSGFFKETSNNPTNEELIKLSNIILSNIKYKIPTFLKLFPDIEKNLSKDKPNAVSCIYNYRGKDLHGITLSSFSRYIKNNYYDKIDDNTKNILKKHLDFLLK